MNQKGDNKETDDGNKSKCCKNVQCDQESASDDETNGWCTFETIV